VLNPNGSTVAFIDKNNVKIYSFIQKETELFDNIRGSKTQIPLALAYSADARRFLVSYSNGKIIFYDTQKYLPHDTIRGYTPAQALIVSPNNYFVVALSDNRADVWNFETKSRRAQLPFDSKANSAAFSTDGSMLAVTTDNKVLIYNTRDWELIQRINTNALTGFPSFNNNGKYLVYAQDKDTAGVVSKHISVYNVLKQAEDQNINESGDIKGLNFINTSQKTTLLSARPKSLVFWNTEGLEPYYGKRLNEEVDQKMNDWIKMMDGESMADYQIRVNDSTRVKQQALFQTT
jgi:WD40 repeat protein